MPDFFDEHGGLLPLDSVRDSQFLHEVSGLSHATTSGTSFASAQADLCASPWSNGFAHGPDTLLPVGVLAEKILRPGENLQLEVFEGGPDSSTVSLCAFDGSFVTDQGRVLSFTGSQRKGSSISPYEDFNELARELFVSSTNENCFGNIAVRLQPPVNSFYTQLYEQSAGVRFATFAETLSMGLSNAFQQYLDATPSTKSLMLSVRNLTPPPSLDIIEKRKTLTLKFQHPHGDGVCVRPFTYRFPFSRQRSTGIVANTPSGDIEPLYALYEKSS